MAGVISCWAERSAQVLVHHRAVHVPVGEVRDRGLYPSGTHPAPIRHTKIQTARFNAGMDTLAARSPIDPVALIKQLDADAIRCRLAELSRERQALLVLLRAALAARRPQQRDRPGSLPTAGQMN